MHNGVLLAAALVCMGTIDAQGAAGSPDATLYDTGSASAETLTPASLRVRTGWTTLEEDDLTHAFKGDAVLANDKLIVVLRRGAVGADVYAQTADGWKHRAATAPVPAGKATASGVRIVENSPGAVMVEASMKTAAGKTASVSYRLTAGQATLQLVGSEGIQELAARAESCYLLAPDFFGDDMVFAPGPEWAERSRIGLPAENFLLALLGRGEAMIMCVWQSNPQAAEAVLAAGPPQVISGWEIPCAKQKSIWLAFFEGQAVWHEVASQAGKGGLDWKRPFDAKWRADVLAPGGFATSFYLDAQPRIGETITVANPKGTVPFSSNENWDSPPLIPSPIPSGRGAAGRPSVVYPIDRSQATPLTVFCPMDVLRNTLGVGPCQYILQTEGLTSETNPTPESVAAWVERQFMRKKAKQSADEMRELLTQMVAHVDRAEARIGRYGRFGSEMEQLLKPPAAHPKGTVPFSSNENWDSPPLKALGPVVARLKAAAAAGLGDPKPSKGGAQLAGQVIQLVDRPNPLAECRRLVANLERRGLDSRCLAGQLPHGRPLAEAGSAGGRRAQRGRAADRVACSRVLTK